MYLIDFINENELIRLIELIQKNDENDHKLLKKCKKYLCNKIYRKERNLYYNEFLFYANLLIIHLKRIEDFDIAISDQLIGIIESSKEEHVKNEKCPIIQIPSNGIIFNSNIVNEFLYLVPNILNTINILQDRFFTLLGYFYNISKKIPNTLPKVKDNNELLKQFGKNIPKIVGDYWKNDGKFIRGYRNIKQHSFFLLNNYIIDTGYKFHLYLPDNPLEKDSNKISYKNKIDSLNVINISVDKFNIFVDDVLKELGCNEKNFSNKSYISPYSETPKNGCINIFQTGNEFICLYLQNGSLTSNHLPNKREYSLKYS